MIEDAITRIIDEHYKPDQARLLMLSNIGERLTKAGNWPLPPEDRRSLRAVIEEMPAVSLVGDPDTPAFLGVVRRGEEQRAHDAIAARHLRFFLKGLPRALLHAFTLEIAAGEQMSVRLGDRLSYIAGPQDREDDLVPVDADLRLPGLDIGDVEGLADADARTLDANIRTWCARHRLSPDQLRRSRKPAASSMPPAPARPTSALERLYAAQEPDVARRMTIPMDIALALSRLS